MIVFSRAKRDERQAAERLYWAALAAARRPGFYLDYGVPDTLQGRFEMVAVNLFPVLHRLMRDPGDDPELARRVAESFVDDMDGALRDVGIGDNRVPKRMKALYGSFAGRVTAYTQALAEDGDALAGAIARNVFPDGGEAAHVRALAGYLRDSVSAVRGADLAALRRGDVPYPDIPASETDR